MELQTLFNNWKHPWPISVTSSQVFIRKIKENSSKPTKLTLEKNQVNQVMKKTTLNQ